MNVLGIETSGDVASVAVVGEQGVRSELSFRHEMQLARHLLARIEEVVSAAGLTIKELGGIAVSRGPGSFTGLRIGVATAKTLAYALDLPVAGVGTLAALAWENPVPAGALVSPLLSASGADVFTALYQWTDRGPAPRAEEVLLPIGDLVKRLSAAPLEILVVGQPGLHRGVLERIPGARVTVAAEERGPNAATIARLGRERILAGQADPVHALAPEYLRPSTAEARRIAAMAAEGACTP